MSFCERREFNSTESEHSAPREPRAQRNARITNSIENNEPAQRATDVAMAKRTIPIRRLLSQALIPVYAWSLGSRPRLYAYACSLVCGCLPALRIREVYQCPN